MHLKSLRSFRFLLSLLLIALVLGCGGGGGGGGSATKTAAFKVRIEWGARSRTVGLSSALSARVTLVNAAADGSNIVWTVNRPVTAAGSAIAQVYDAPTSATLGSHNLGVTFYAQANAGGDAVGTAGAVASITETGTNELSLSTYAGVDAVRVLPNQSVKVGEIKELLFEAKNASGTVVALSTGSAFFTVTSGTASLETVNDGSSVRGKAPSTSAEVIVKVDQATSAAAVVKVTSDTTVTVSPETGTLGSEFTLDLSAVVGGAPETGVQFTVEGGATNGTLESVATNSATYVAPKVTGTTSRVCKVVVTSNYDPSVSKTISVTVEPRTSVTITPTSPTANRNGTTNLSATVSNLSPRVPAGDRGVTWRVLDDGSGQPVGTISTAGVYTAPNRDGTFTIEATSFYDTTKKATIGVVVVRGPSFTELPLPAGATGLNPVDLSEDGQVVALDVTNPLFTRNPPYLWTEAGGYSQIGMTSITAISGDGSVAVGYVSVGGDPKPARWTKASGVQIYDPIGNSVAFDDVSENGTLAIMRNSANNIAVTQILGGSSIVSVPMFAYRISGDGTTLVGFRLQAPYFSQIPVRWTSVEGVQDFPLLEGLPAGSAKFASTDGSIISGDDTGRAWRWTRSNGMSNLGKLPGRSFSSVTGMSPDGTIVFMASQDGGGISTPPSYGVWIVGRGLISLADFIAEKGFASSISGWQEVSVYRCSADNKTFFGYGKNTSGRWSAWVMRL